MVFIGAAEDPNNSFFQIFDSHFHLFHAKEYKTLLSFIYLFIY